MKQSQNNLKLLLLSIFVFIVVTGSAQLNKGIWLAGGNASFTSITQKTGGNQFISRTTDISLTPKIGYFFIDKFAGGIQLVFNSNTYTTGNTTTQNSTFVGPFIRYYLLPKVNTTNIFTELAYGHNSSGNTGYSSNVYAFATGPVFFLNSSVGIEVPLSYTINAANDGTHSGIFKIGVGFQVHLEKK